MAGDAMDVQHMTAVGADARIQLGQDRVLGWVRGAWQSRTGTAGVSHDGAISMGEYNSITVPPYVRQLLHPAFQARQTRVVLRCELFSRRLVPNVLGEPMEAYFA
jgi:hypothetical protein